ncbi:MFS transporter [Halorubraceae archaeon YAN]|nr:MFS transporter [Halorubraceae archaeon YAN]
MKWRYPYTVLVLCTLAFFVTMVGRLSISPVVTDIVAEFQVSNALIGVALSGMWLTYGLSQYPSGILADRFGERRIILVSIGGTIVASLLLIIAPNIGVFILATVLLGAVAGLHYSVATTLLARKFDRIGSAVGIHNTGATLAGLLTPIIVAWVAVRYGWRPAIGVTVLLGTPVFILFFWRIRETPPRKPSQPMLSQIDIGAAVELLSRPAIAFTLVLAIIGEFVWQGTASFLPTFLIEHRGQSTTLAGTVFSVYFIAQGVGQVVVGAASDRFGRDQTTAGCMLVGAAGIALLILTPGLLSAILGGVFLGIGMSFGAALLPRFLDEMSDEEQATGFGLVRSVYMIFAALGSVVTGVFADLFGWAAAFAFLCALLLFLATALTANKLFNLGL